MAGIGEFFLGKPQSIEQINRFNPQQQNALQMLLSSGMQGFKNPYEGFGPIEQRARSQFQQNTVPSLAERFSSLGNNAISSPAFASQLGQAGAGLEEGLAALRSQYGMQNRSQLMQLLGLGLTPQFENVGIPGAPGLLQQLLPALGRGASLGVGAGLNALSGGSLGAFGSLF